MSVHRVTVALRKRRMFSRSRLARFARAVRWFAELVMAERKEPFPVPLRRKLKMWSHGFLSTKYVSYGLDRNDMRDYLSDYARYVRTTEINHPFSNLLDNKLVFGHFMRSLGYHFATNYGVIVRGRVHLFSELEDLGGMTTLKDLCRCRERLILKPSRGGTGSRVAHLCWDGSKFLVNGVAKNSSELDNWIDGLNEFVINEFVGQAEYAARMFPRTANSIRLQTMWDVDTDTPFLAAAIHKFGTEKSFPVDNARRGGVSSAIDLETGELGPATPYAKSAEIEWYDRHPDTGVQIRGIRIPGWSQVKQNVLELAAAIPYLPYVGWDIVMEGEGSFCILEGNSYSNVMLLQQHRPLLKDPRVRRFFQAHQVIR